MTGEVHGTGERRPRLVDHLAAELARAGVTHLFGVGGANIEDLYDAVHRHGAMRAVVAKHEFSAVTMADGYARSTGRLGVVVATSGGGAMNLVPGLAEAHASRVPVLAVVGQPPTGQEGRGAFQDSSGKAGSFDAGEVFGPVSRFCARAEDAQSLVELLPRAIAAARTDPKGPAVLLLPKDVQQALVRVPAPGGEPTQVPVRRGTRSDDSAREAAASTLRDARSVLVVAGEGVASAHAREEVAELAGRLGAWVAVTPDAKDVFDNRDPRFVGVAGVMGHANVEDCLRRADVCLLVGTRLPSMARGGLDRTLAATPVVCVDPEPPFVPGISLGGDVRATLRTLMGSLPSRPRPCPPHPGPVPMSAPTARRGPAMPWTGGRTRRRTLSFADAFAAVEAALPQDAHVFVDAGNTGAGAVHLLPAPRHGRFVVAVGMGGMGYTFGAGIGAALATGRRTYVLAGDGAFFMHGMEVHTAVEYAAPVTFVIFNNNAHAMCATRERLFQGGVRDDDLFAPADIAAGVAATFPALDTTRAETAAQLRRALLRGNARRGPAFVALECDPYEMPPFLPFLASAGQAQTGSESEESAHERGPVHVG
ncbi:thiamine pyrophosphate-binding protein [Wenjunlia tyrosinilytica]|uniref:Acetolactate synthase, large subunit n=1 Tax=Wenjunlia tyrosinilytica TaxID=1544741 RepID=A0A917ZQT2_9ACTN|nr:thiamine pyrophosphate-binding protein [Wenjunlia tyrosinilytica]GGO90021.1 putative acetolactate synthase, large subunit [Wenjunlia tyrosinilytica]